MAAQDSLEWLGQGSFLIGSSQGLALAQGYLCIFVLVPCAGNASSPILSDLGSALTFYKSLLRWCLLCRLATTS